MKKNILLVAAVSISSLLFSQSDSTVTSLDEVVVTATKSELKTSLTGKVLTVITRQQLEQSGGKDLSQILTEQAGLYIGGANSNAGKDKSVYLRGARVDHTLITLDGIPVYDPGGIGNNFDIRNIAVEQVERVEILKGSQSTLYGSDAIAGVINIITRKPVSGKPVLNTMASYGSNQTARLGFTFSGKAKEIDYLTGYSFLNSKGINETESTDGDRDGIQQHNVTASAGWKISEKFRLSPFIRFSRMHGDLDQGAFTDELDYTYRQNSLQAGIRNEYFTGNSSITLIYQANTISREYIDDSTKSRNGFDTYSRGYYEGTEHFADLFAHTSLSNMLKLTAGIDYRKSNSNQEYRSIGFWGPFNSEYANDSLNQSQLGVYAALNLLTPKGFNLELGNRLNIHSGFGNYHVFNVNPSYLLNNRWKLFANISSGYKVPSLYQLFSEYGNKDLKPEAALTSEAGLQFLGKNDRYKARALVFSRRVNDVIFFYFNPSTFQSQYINQDRQQDHGVEAEFTAAVSDKFSLSGHYTFVNGKINTIKNGKDTSYFNLLRRPKHSVGLSFNGRFGNRLKASLNLQYFGKRNDSYFDATSFQTVSVTLKSYFLCHVYAEYNFSNERLSWFADLRNITNSRFTEISGFRTNRFNAFTGIRFSL